MERQANQLARLVDDMTDISRITIGRIELKKEATSLAEILNSAIESSRLFLEAAITVFRFVCRTNQRTCGPTRCACPRSFPTS